MISRISSIKVFQNGTRPDREAGRSTARLFSRFAAPAPVGGWARLAGRARYRGKGFGVEAGAAHEQAADFVDAEDRRGITGLGGAAVEDGDCGAVRARFGQLGPESTMNNGDVRFGRNAARADRPDRFISDRHRAAWATIALRQRAGQLPAHDAEGLPGIPL